MSNKTPITFSFPIELQKEYYRLTQSKWDFSENLSPAERTKLGILYEDLENVWNRNTTETLNKTLNQSYQELREMQSESESDWNSYESNIENQLSQDLEKRMISLKEKKANSNIHLKKLKDNYTKSITENKQILRGNILIWKEDTLQNLSQLDKSKQLLTGNLSLDKELEELKKILEDNLNQKKQELTTSLTALKEKRDISRNLSSQNQDLRKILREKDFNLRTKKESLNRNLQILKDKNKKNLTDLEKSFYQMKERLENSQNSLLRKELEATMKGNTNKLLKELTIEIYRQEMNCPKKLKPYLIYGDYSSIMMMYKQLLKDSEKEEKLLKMDLTKNGINSEWFMNNLP